MKDMLYVESSALVAAMIEGDAGARRVLRGAATRVTSALTIAECRRAILRARASRSLGVEADASAAEFLRDFSAHCHIVPVNPAILERAGRAFVVEPVRTLDAIHLATLELMDEPPQLVGVLTRDRRIAANAHAMGYEVR